jgi:hypothetical protein
MSLTCVLEGFEIKLSLSKQVLNKRGVLEKAVETRRNFLQDDWHRIIVGALLFLASCMPRG